MVMTQNVKKMDFFNCIQNITEKYLTYRAGNRRIKKEKREKKGQIRDWIDAFLWAACMVLLANQYLVQAYRIPSGSMIDTLLIGDHVFVNKLVYGPELLPGVLKLSSPVKPKRNDIIVFENPTYISRGPVFDVTQRIIYMLTFTLVDIDKDESGDPRVHFLIKRAAGVAGDHLSMQKGEMKIRFAGEDRWIDEKEFIRERGWNHNITRLMKEEQYDVLLAAGKAAGWNDLRLQPSAELLQKIQGVERLTNPDFIAHEIARIETLRKMQPQDNRYGALLARHRLGWYVPEGRIFPMGDSRDNSRDGRYFGPVKVSRVLGKGMVVYWPLKRMRKMR